MKNRSLPYFVLTFALAILFTTKAFTQDTYQPLYFDATVQNMHLWRGYKVSTNTLSTFNAGYTTKDGSFSAGFWNGSSFNGSYTEFDYYVSYTFKNGTNISLWDINNFSDFPDANIFDYRRASTSHFIDLSVRVPVTKALNLSMATILAGRDTYMNIDNQLNNAFSTYMEANYCVLNRSDMRLNIFAGGAFSPVSGQHFYGERPGIVNLGFNAGTAVPFFDGVLPVSAQAMWNPELKYGAMQLSVQVF